MPRTSVPVIGIPCMDLRIPDAPPRQAQNRSYAAAIERAGGAPCLIPQLAQAEALAALYERCDGVLLPGGGDLEPALFGEPVRAQLRSVSPLRDAMEISLARWSLEPGAPRPLLAICRGIQVLNVALGGSLYQDLRQRRRPTDNHDRQEQVRTFLAHRVDTRPRSLLHRIVGMETLETNSLHHQAVKRLAPGLAVAGRSPDGVVEAVEVRGHPFALGVQWHPEEMAPSVAWAQHLFDAFVASCRA